MYAKHSETQKEELSPKLDHSQKNISLSRVYCWKAPMAATMTVKLSRQVHLIWIIGIMN